MAIATINTFAATAAHQWGAINRRQLTSTGLSRDQIERLRVAGLSRASRYSWAETARLTLEVYRELLA
jgi:hypothetical protein